MNKIRILQPKIYSYRPGEFRERSSIRSPLKKDFERITHLDWSLMQRFNYSSLPGCHSQLSPVVGSRTLEYTDLWKSTRENPAMIDFETAIYCPRDFINLIPYSKKEKADALAEKMFLEYLEKYSGYGITVRNIVSWIKSGTARGWPNSTQIFDQENKGTVWHVRATVGDGKDDVVNGYYSPKMIIARHEMDHVEETPVNLPEAIRYFGPRELMARLETILLLDEIYKKIFGFSIEEEVNYPGTTGQVNYCKMVIWENNSVPLGRLANYFRMLKRTYGTIGKAVVSPEALDIINGKARISKGCSVQQIIY